MRRGEGCGREESESQGVSSQGFLTFTFGGTDSPLSGWSVSTWSECHWLTPYVPARSSPQWTL